MTNDQIVLHLTCFVLMRLIERYLKLFAHQMKIVKTYNSLTVFN